MDNFTAQFVYRFNILVFIATIAILLGECYLLLIYGSIATQQGVPLWSTQIVITTSIPFLLPLVSFFVVRKLSKYKKEEKLTELFILGILSIAGVFGVIFMTFLSLMALSMM